MTQKEIKDSIEKGITLKWDDPDPIEDNDYTIHKVFELNEETALIHYGCGVEISGKLAYSEAEVYLNEISIS